MCVKGNNLNQLQFKLEPKIHIYIYIFYMTKILIDQPKRVRCLVRYM